MVTKQTPRSAGIGWLVGAVTSVVPLVMLLSPLIAGGVAGYLPSREEAPGRDVGADG